MTAHKDLAAFLLLYRLKTWRNHPHSPPRLCSSHQALQKGTHLKASSPLYKLALVSSLADRKSLNTRRARDFWTSLQKGVWKIMYWKSLRVNGLSIPSGRTRVKVKRQCDRWAIWPQFTGAGAWGPMRTTLSKHNPRLLIHFTCSCYTPSVYEKSGK